MTQLARLTLAVLLTAIAFPARAGEVRVSFAHGLVTIVATEASPRQILSEWARQGQVRISNLDRLAGGPITLQLIDVPEAQALETLLRGSAGYVAAPRAEAVVAASGYDRIVLMPGVAPTLPAGGSSPAATKTMGAGRGRPSNIPMFDTSSDDDSDTARAVMGPGAARYDATRQPGQGQVVMPGIMMPGPYAGTSGSAATTGQPPVIAPVSEASTRDARPPASVGAATPGVLTAPPTPPQSQPQPVMVMPNSNDGPHELPAPPAMSAPVVNPSANPYGVTAPVKATPAPPAPPGPIKKPGTDGGQG